MYEYRWFCVTMFIVINFVYAHSEAPNKTGVEATLIPFLLPHELFGALYDAGKSQAWSYNGQVLGKLIQVPPSPPGLFFHIISDPIMFVVDCVSGCSFCLGRVFHSLDFSFGLHSTELPNPFFLPLAP